MTAFDPRTHPGHPGKSRRHLPGLDGVRGLAILMVMFSHFIVVGGNLKSGEPLSIFLKSGYLGVDLFFVLSGFLITGILLDSKSSPRYFSVFYIRRALRIFPVYYGLLAAAWLTVRFITPQDRAELTGVDSMAWSWLYASNIGMAVKGSWLTNPTWVNLGHFWSLAVEEQFYLVWPLVVYLLPERALKWLCLVLVATSPLTFKWLTGWLGVDGTYVSTLSRLGVLAAGGGLAILWRHPEAWRRGRIFLPWALAAAGAALLLERTIFLKQLAAYEPTLVLIAGSACVGLAACGGGGPLLTGFFQSRALIWLGKYSYGIYVYHHAFKPVWIHFFWERWLVPQLGGGWPATLAYTGLATAASLSLAWISWKCFEAPILSLKSRFNY